MGSDSSIVALHVGADAMLLSTRTDVLRRTGLRIVPASSVPEAVRMFLAGDYDLVIVCHSVPADSRRALTNLVHSHSSSVPVILVTIVPEQDLFVDAIVDGEAAKLVAEIPQILSRWVPMTALSSRPSSERPKAP
ncbi:MAG: hypothetical protein ABI383_08755 [Acidobacteriaceae bacterium]